MTHKSYLNFTLHNLLKVHTANSWEKADLGDDDRKLKFLKLMGASKVNFMRIKQFFK